MRKLLFTILPVFLLLITVDVVQAQTSKAALSGNWTLTDVYIAGPNKANRDVKETSSARVDLLDNHQLAYHFTDTRLSIRINGEATFLYYYSIDKNSKISIDEPLQDAFFLMVNLELVKLTASTLVLKCNGPDSNNKFIYQEFSRN
ncbi:MAG: hypothetical protein GY751_07465 [Bacteroidetes bacterium]|nr:hypothetical protein [Bacteroidota bacterium]